MKKILKPILALTLLGALITSCTDESDLLILAAKGEYAILTPNSGDAVTLDLETPTNPGLSISWAKADYGITPTVITYNVEIDKSGDNFDTPVILTSSTDLFATVTSDALNTAALSLGLAPFEQGSLEVRIASSVGIPASDIKYSNVINYLVTPYSSDLPRIYVVGNFLANGGYGSDWTPANAVALASSDFGKTDSEGYIYFNQASFEYKFLPTNVSFDGDYGDDGNFSGALVQDNEVNAVGSSAGYYRVKANLGANTPANTQGLKYNIQKVSWGIIGFATLGNDSGWNQDIDMTYNATSKKWEITLPMTAGKFKFRYNDTWNVGDSQLNLGEFDASKTGENYGGKEMSYGGGDLTISTTGTYKISLDLSNPRDYQYTAVLQ
jgi:hypothetical protein